MNTTGIESALEKEHEVAVRKADGCERDRGRIRGRPAGHEQCIVQHLADVIGLSYGPGIMADRKRAGIAQRSERAEPCDVFANLIVGLKRSRTGRLIEEL